MNWNVDNTIIFTNYTSDSTDAQKPLLYFKKVIARGKLSNYSVY